MRLWVANADEIMDWGEMVGFLPGEGFTWHMKGANWKGLAMEKDGGLKWGG